MIDPDTSDLPAFLHAIRAGAPPLAPLACGRATAAWNTKSCSADLAAEIARLADRPLPGLTLYKFGSRSIVGSHPLPAGGSIVLKYYYPSSTARHIAYGIRGSRCHQSWIAALAFQHLGIPTPPPLAIAEWRLLGNFWLSKSFLATRQAPGISLREFVTAHPEDTAALTAIAARLTDAFTLMARHRIAHGDLKASNIIVDTAGENAISFIDLDAAEILMPPAKWAAANAKDRRRFAKNWQPFPTAARLFKDVFAPA